MLITIFTKTSKFRKHLFLILFSFAFFTSPAICQWVDKIGGAGQEFGQDVKTDASGNVFVTGNFSGTADFDPGPGVFNLKSSCPCDESDPAKADIFLAKYTINGNLVWALKIGGGSTDRVEAMGLDAAGNIYLTGQFESTADFDPGAGTKNLTSTGSTDIFVAKYNTNGQLVWANKLGGTLNDDGTGIAVDKSGNVFVTGSFLGVADFDPGTGVTNFNSNGTTDVFFAKYTTNGNLVWAKDIQGTGEQNGRKIELDKNGNIYLTGSFFGTSDLDPGAGVTNLTGAGSQDPYFAKYNINGELIWAKSIGATFDESALDIAVDVNGNLFATGFFTGTTDFDPGPGVNNLTSSAGGLFDAFLLKLNNSGDFQWAFKIGSAGDDVGQSVAVDSLGNPFICGSFQGTVDFNPGPEMYQLTAGGNDLYFAKYNTAGKFLWAQNAGGAADEVASSIAAGSNGSVCLTGYFSGRSTFNTGTSSTVLTTSGNADVFLLKFSPPAATSTLEAEQAVLSGAVIAADQPGFTGPGFADYVHASGDFIEWTVNASSAGFYSLNFRYANGGTANRPLKLEVNGVVITAGLSFVSTSGWAIWSVSSATANLISGNNKIRLTTAGYNGPNVDNLTFNIAACQTGMFEAEQAVLHGAVVASDKTGFTGSGFADYTNASGDFIEWTVNALAAGSYSLQFRYANGGTADRPLKLEVNGIIQNPGLSFSRTGSWTVWSVSSAIASLTAGTNKVRLTVTGANGPNMDNLAISCNSSVQPLQSTAQNLAISESFLQPGLNLLKASVSPNPVEGSNAKLIVSASSSLPIELKVFDMSGRSYKSFTLVPGGSNTLDFPVNNLAPGAYTILLKQGNLRTHVKLIVAGK